MTRNIQADQQKNGWGRRECWIPWWRHPHHRLTLTLLRMFGPQWNTICRPMWNPELRRNWWEEFDPSGRALLLNNVPDTLTIYTEWFHRLSSMEGHPLTSNLWCVEHDQNIFDILITWHLLLNNLPGNLYWKYNTIYLSIMLFLVFIKDWFFFKQIICMPVFPRQYNPDLRGNLSCLKMFFLANGLHILIYIYIFTST